MSISYDICQTPGVPDSPSCRAWIKVMLGTAGGVPRSADPTGGGLGKAVTAAAGRDAPVFVVEDNAVPEDPSDGYSKAAIDVFWKGNAYRVHFRMKNNSPWQAFRIVTLPPMFHYERATAKMKAAMGRTELLTDTLAEDMQNAQQLDSYSAPLDSYGSAASSYSTPASSYSTPG
jgi:hypothetical protein